VIRPSEASPYSSTGYIGTKPNRLKWPSPRVISSTANATRIGKRRGLLVINLVRNHWKRSGVYGHQALFQIGGDILLYREEFGISEGQLPKSNPILMRRVPRVCPV